MKSNNSDSDYCDNLCSECPFGKAKTAKQVHDQLVKLGRRKKYTVIANEVLMLILVIGIVVVTAIHLA